MSPFQPVTAEYVSELVTSVCPLSVMVSDCAAPLVSSPLSVSVLSPVPALVSLALVDATLTVAGVASRLLWSIVAVVMEGEMVTRVVVWASLWPKMETIA